MEFARIVPADERPAVISREFIINSLRLVFMGSLSIGGLQLSNITTDIKFVTEESVKFYFTWKLI